MKKFLWLLPILLVLLWSASAHAAAQTFQMFLPAIEICRANSVNVIPTRIAASDWALSRTSAGAETYIFNCELGSVAQRAKVGNIRGIRVASIGIVHQITVVPLTSNTWGKVSQVTYANATANVISAALEAASPTLPTDTSQATPYITTVSFTAPALFIAAGTIKHTTVEWTVVMANTGVYSLYGINVNYEVLQ